MKYVRLSFLAILFAFAPCQPIVAQAPTPAPVADVPYVKLPDVIEVKQPGEWIVIVPLERNGGDPQWEIGEGLEPVRLDLLFPDAKPKGIVVKGSKGTYEVRAWNAKGGVASRISRCKIIIGDGKPDPIKPPVDPPNPPDADAPIPVAGLHVLIIHETSIPVTKGQYASMNGELVRSYLKANAKNWNVLDPNVTIQTPIWKNAMARPRTKVPWIIVSRADGPAGFKGFEGPLPNTPEETLALIKKYAEAK